jgi:hypothetical protein
MRKLVFKMTTLFVPFYTYTFEHMLKSVEDFSASLKKKSKGAKRSFKECDMFYVLQNEQVGFVLDNF